LKDRRSSPKLALIAAAEAADFTDLSVVGIRSDTTRSSGLELRDAVDLPPTDNLPVSRVASLKIGRL
jgi:hypothetical protein